MAQDIQALLTKYSVKASGVYREIIDGTAEPATESTQNVVVVGQFAKGPVMKPIRCKDVATAHAVFGVRNTKLEAKGNFGMLMAEHLLELGKPIYILNVKNINQYNETLQARQLAVNNEETDQLLNEPIATVYDTTKFWQVDTMYGSVGADAPVLTFAAVQQGDMTIIITKYVSDSNYMDTVATVKSYNPEWDADNFDANSRIQDYMVQVHVFKTNLAAASLQVPNAIVNGKINLAVLDKIQDDPASEYFATYTGAIGDIIDASGNNLNIANIMNADMSASGIYTAINNDAIAAKGIDLKATGAIVFDQSGASLPTVKDVSRLGYVVSPTLQPICIYVDTNRRTEGYMFGEAQPGLGDIIASESKFVRVMDKKYIANKYALNDTSIIGTEDCPIMPDGLPFPKSLNGTVVYPSYSPKAGQPVEFASGNVKWYKESFVQQLANWDLSQPATAIVAGTDVHLNCILNGMDMSLRIPAFESVAELISNLNSVFSSYATFESLLDTVLDAPIPGSIADFGLQASEQAGKLVHIACTTVPKGCDGFQIVSLLVDDVLISVDTAAIASNSLVLSSAAITVSGSGTAFTVTCDGVTNNVNFDAVAAMYGDKIAIYKLTFSEPLSSALDGNEAVLTNGGTMGVAQMENILGQAYSVMPNSYMYLQNWYNSVSTAPILNMSGYADLESHYVNGTAARQKAILDRLNDAGIMTSFADPTIFRCRYMIDSFKTYIEPNAKYQYAVLSDNAKRFLTIAPAPFYYELRNCKNPDFHDILGQFDMAYVAAGKNPDKPSTNSFSYPQNSDTAKYINFYMNVKYNNGFGDKIVPSVGAIGKLFYSKLDGVRKVYDIVAGPDYPVSAAGIVGPEFDSGPEDRAAMEKMGTNVLQTINGVLQVRSNKTAFQTVISAFNYTETLEKCFFVSDYVEPVLSGKLFKYNTADARLTVKKRADAACDILVADQVIASYDNICDDRNNTKETRKAGFIILDTILYNEYGIRIAIHRTTVKDPQE